MNNQLARSCMENVWSNGIALANFYTFFINNPHLSFWQKAQIFAVRPDVRYVKSFDDWHTDHDRRISRGSKGIPYYDENDPYRRKYVFDISQTYGDKDVSLNKYKLSENELYAVIRRQYVFDSISNDDDKVKTAVYEYCKGHYGYSNNEEYDEEYLACLTEGITSSLYEITGNKREPDVASLPFDYETNFKLCQEVVNITNGLLPILEQEVRRIENEKIERERIRKLRRESADNRKLTAGTERKSQSVQQTLWDFAAELFNGSVSREVHRTPDVGAVIYSDGESASGSRTVTGNIGTATLQTSFLGTDILAESKDIAGNRTDYRGDDSRTSNLQPAVNYPYGENSRHLGHVEANFPATLGSSNYRLSAENFDYSTGQKTRYKNNVAAIRLMYTLEQEKRQATNEEKTILSRYVGWGGIPQVFDSENPSWSNEYKELYELLSDKEYRLAKESVLNAHYTSKTVIDGIYAGLKRIGLTQGKILEPAMGIGNFIGLMPDTFKASETYGVELDSITGRIAKLLYPETHIEVKGFEETNYANNSFDAVITNVPFGSYKVYDRDYDKQGFYIHNYFIAKSLDKVRSGGIVAVVTSKGTMDKETTDVRQYIADRAELLGAIRLPNTAFKASANTEVTSDILFFRKRDKVITATDSWIQTSDYPVATESDEQKYIQINSYFAENPEMLLGTMAQQSTLYGNETETTLLPDDRDLGEAIMQAVQNLPENVYDSKKAVKTGEKIAAAVLPVDENLDRTVKNYCYEILDGKIYQRVDNEMIAQDIPRSNYGRMTGMIDLRKQVRRILEYQINNCSDEELTAEQRKLHTLYDRFVRDYGLLNGRTNRSLFREDSDFALLISIENVDEASQTATKTDIFSKRTIQPFIKVTSCESVTEALGVCKNERGFVDLGYIQTLTGKSYDDVIQELDGKIYQNPTDAALGFDDPYKGWEIASEYLSGNVRKKLEIAKQAAQINPAFKKNVDALTAVQPTPLAANEISVRLGATWIKPEYYRQFVCELLKIKGYEQDNVTVSYERFTGEWRVSRNAYMRYDMNANQVYGTKRMDAYKIIEHCLNQQTPTIYDTVEEADGSERRVLNKQETIAAREKQNKIKQAFKDWIFDDPKRRADLVGIYNELFNNTVVAKYDGSYLQFPEMSPLIMLKDFQKDAVERGIVSGNMLLHHVVGAGKTFEITALAMKMRQLGLAKKPMIVVPNHLVVQWANSFRELYPNANVLMATKKDFEKTNRKRFVARVATGDWDAVIIASSSFEKIPISQERQRAKIQSELDSITKCIESLEKERGERATIKSLVRAMLSKRAVLKKLTDDNKKDDFLTFESLGVDALFVDEAHRYKNKFIYTRMNNVAGISKAMSQRASDMDMKCEYINEMHEGNKGVVFATGTPISNSMVEMFTMQSYLQRDQLKSKGMEYFDGWAANFGETVTGLELAPSGQGYRTRTRFAKFTNLPELLTMYRSFADVKTADMLNLPVPKANKITVTAQPSEEILRLNDEIVDRAQKISNREVEPHIDNMLCVCHDGKKIALDPRCYVPTTPDNPNNKVNLCVENLYRIWRDTAENRSAQIVFCDLSTPKCAFADYNPETNFDVYNDIKYKLVGMGIAPEEIAYIHEANTDLQKQELFDKVRRGDIRILIGSTEKCGAGTNCQNKLVALHHLDTPFRPSDLEQREGRIIRQGNENPEVSIFTYVTERTFDAYSYQILESKQRFISQINKGDLSVREAADIDETTLSFAEIKAIVAANPKIKRKMEIEQEVSRLRTLEYQHKQNKYSLQDRIIQLPKEIERERQYLENARKDKELRDNNRTDEFNIRIGKTDYTERKDGGDKLCAVVNSQEYVDKIIGSYCGFNIIPCARENLFKLQNIKLVGNNTYYVEISDSGIGTATRLENFVKSIEDSIETHEKRKANLEDELRLAQSEVDKPFEYVEELYNLDSELNSLNAELDLDKAEVEPVMDDEQLQDEPPVIELDTEDSRESNSYME